MKSLSLWFLTWLTSNQIPRILRLLSFFRPFFYYHLVILTLKHVSAMIGYCILFSIWCINALFVRFETMTLFFDVHWIIGCYCDDFVFLMFIGLLVVIAITVLCNQLAKSSFVFIAAININIIYNNQRVSTKKVTRKNNANRWDTRGRNRYKKKITAMVAVSDRYLMPFFAKNSLSKGSG